MSQQKKKDENPWKIIQSSNNSNRSSGNNPSNQNRNFNKPSSAGKIKNLNYSTKNSSVNNSSNSKKKNNDSKKWTSQQPQASSAAMNKNLNNNVVVSNPSHYNIKSRTTLSSSSSSQIPIDNRGNNIASSSGVWGSATKTVQKIMNQPVIKRGQPVHPIGNNTFTSGDKNQKQILKKNINREEKSNVFKIMKSKTEETRQHQEPKPTTKLSTAPKNIVNKAKVVEWPSLSSQSSQSQVTKVNPTSASTINYAAQKQQQLQHQVQSTRNVTDSGASAWPSLSNKPTINSHTYTKGYTGAVVTKTSAKSINTRVAAPAMKPKVPSSKKLTLNHQPSPQILNKKKSVLVEAKSKSSIPQTQTQLNNFLKPPQSQQQKQTSTSGIKSNSKTNNNIYMNGIHNQNNNPSKSKSKNNNAIPKTASASNPSAATGGTYNSSSSGKQRVNPKKKKLTSLKKSILTERFQKWNEKLKKDQEQLFSSNGNKNDNANHDGKTLAAATTTTTSNNNNDSNSNTLAICNYITEQDLMDFRSDPDHYEEVISDLHEFCHDFLGISFSSEEKKHEHPEQNFTITLPSINTEKETSNNTSTSDILIHFETKSDFDKAMACWNKSCSHHHNLSTHSSPLTTCTENINHNNNNTILIDGQEIYVKPLQLQKQQQNNKVVDCLTLSWWILLENILSPDDLDDEECLEETKSDVISFFSENNEDGVFSFFYNDEGNNKSSVNMQLFTLIARGGGGLGVDAAAESFEFLCDHDSKEENLLLKISLTVTIIEISTNTNDNVETSPSLSLSRYYHQQVLNAIPKINEKKFGGDFLSAKLLHSSEGNNNHELIAERDFSSSSSLSSSSNTKTNNTTSSETNKATSASPITPVLLKNVLTEEDYEDEDCLEETKEDLKALAQQYGDVCSIDVNTQNEGEGFVSITYKNEDAARKAVECFNGMNIGGNKIIAEFHTRSNDVEGESSTNIATVILSNILSEEDYEDEDCLEETKSDILSLCQSFGKVLNFKLEDNKDDEGQKEDKEGLFYVTYSTRNEATSARDEFDGKVIGGMKVKAVLFTEPEPAVALEKNSSSVNNNNNNNDGKNLTVTTSEQITTSSRNNNDEEKTDQGENEIPKIFSGNKYIPNKYALCKLTPKIPNQGIPREYASKKIQSQTPSTTTATTTITNNTTSEKGDKTTQSLIFEMLGELMKFQQRAQRKNDTKNLKARRRLVFGLREVARGIRAHKIKMVLMAHNVDEYGVLDEKLGEILRLSKEEDIPVLFELNKRKLGKALGKTIKVSVVGVQNADGAYDSFKKLKKIYDKMGS